LGNSLSTARDGTGAGFISGYLSPRPKGEGGESGGEVWRRSGVMQSDFGFGFGTRGRVASASK